MEVAWQTYLYLSVSTLACLWFHMQVCYIQAQLENVTAENVGQKGCQIFYTTEEVIKRKIMLYILWNMFVLMDTMWGNVCWC